MPPMLDVEDLRKTFVMHVLGGKRIAALEGVSFSLAEGEIMGLTGTSGSGKSTLMKCVHRTYLPSGGRIRLRTAAGPVDLASASEHEVLRVRRTEMTYCSQFLQAIPRVPAAEVAAEGMLRRGVARDEALRRARACFERLGLPQELWDAYPATFSGGEQQRVNISRAMLAEPRFLLVDEPTASLDLTTKDAVIDMMLELRDRGTAMMLISHDDHTLTRAADRRLHLEHGRLRPRVH